MGAPFVEDLIEKTHDMNAFKFVVIDRFQPQEYAHRSVYRALFLKETLDTQT